MEPLGINAVQVNLEIGVSARDRRRRMRHKVHTPAYVSFGADSAGMVLDLNEILDISEDGICIQSSSPLASERILHLCLDLSNSKGQIYTTGQVIWSNSRGRTGIRFPSISPASRHQLQEWLFLNAIAGCVNQQSAGGGSQGSVAGRGVVEPYPSEPEPAYSPDHTTILAALSAVKREVEMMGQNLDAALQLITDRVLAFTGGTGAAIALSDDGGGMRCRATAGSDAPPLGASVNTDSGLSGACIRNGQVLYCDDSETDARVDPNICRALGVRSIIAVPIHVGASVVGLLEVFSSEPRAFGVNAALILQHLAETGAAAIRRESLAPPLLVPTAEEKAPSPTKDVDGPIVAGNSWVRRGLLIATGVTIIGALLWLLFPRAMFPAATEKKPVIAVNSKQTAPLASSTPVFDLDHERALAQNGDPVEQFALGVRYATGDEVQQDYTEAARWFLLAANQGHVGAQETMGAYYWAGRGVPQDFSKAYFWSALAQAGGDEASKYRVAILASRMSRSEILAAQEQAEHWLHDHEGAAQHTDPE
jgi:GAF domain/PilZ domain/Sel1 repeat